MVNALAGLDALSGNFRRRSRGARLPMGYDMFQSPEDNDRRAFVDAGTRAFRQSPVTQDSKNFHGFTPLFEALKRKELAAGYDGQKFDVDYGRGGVTTNRTAMGGPMPARARKPVDYLEDGRFDVTDDPRVQQALTRQALDALDPVLNNPEAARGRELQDSVLEENRQDVRGLRRARDFGVPMAAIKREQGDLDSEAEARREWFPARASLRDQEFERRYRMATDPAQIAAEGRERVAGITGDSRVDAANARRPDPIEMLIEALSQTDKGAFGVDEQGRPIPAPDDLRQRLREALMGRTAPGAATAGPPARGGGAGPATNQSPQAQGGTPKPGDRRLMPDGKMAVWANDEGVWDWYYEGE